MYGNVFPAKASPVVVTLVWTPSLIKSLSAFQVLFKQT